MLHGYNCNVTNTHPCPLLHLNSSNSPCNFAIVTAVGSWLLSEHAALVLQPVAYPAWAPAGFALT